MFKALGTALCLAMLSFSSLFAGTLQMPPGAPPRKDLVDSNSRSAQIKLQRAERILSTLVFDPQNYHLVLSTRTSFGGEAVHPFVFSDKPTLIIYQGSLAPGRSDEELAFMMAHELGHLNLYHNERMNQIMEGIMTGPLAGISGTTFSIYFQKMQEQQADMFGLYLYKKAGYDINFFPFTLRLLNINPNIHYGSTSVFRKDPTSLSLRDAHYNMKERFELLVYQSQFPIQEHTA